MHRSKRLKRRREWRLPHHCRLFGSAISIKELKTAISRLPPPPPPMPVFVAPSNPDEETQRQIDQVRGLGGRVIQSPWVDKATFLPGEIFQVPRLTQWRPSSNETGAAK